MILKATIGVIIIFAIIAFVKLQGKKKPSKDAGHSFPKPKGGKHVGTRPPKPPRT